MICAEVQEYLRNKDPRKCTTAEVAAVHSHMNQCQECTDLAVKLVEETFAKIPKAHQAISLLESLVEAVTLRNKLMSDPEYAETVSKFTEE